MLHFSKASTPSPKLLLLLFPFSLLHSLEFHTLGKGKGRVEEFLAAGEAGDPYTKPFFFPVVSAATCADHYLEVDQRALVSTLLGLVSTHCPKTAQKVFWEGL
ncbi:hypothetical protein Taro_032691 [Colocasia esculenta]|uniref:Uncharacterized protein n=1 Tax=Colocasia esculenta TaxID=4460 RepID=A0A843W2L5_COLES|nr:hypothetical protein [Colocasia esculenta]